MQFCFRVFELSIDGLQFSSPHLCMFALRCKTRAHLIAIRSNNDFAFCARKIQFLNWSGSGAVLWECEDEFPIHIHFHFNIVAFSNERIAFKFLFPKPCSVHSKQLHLFSFLLCLVMLISISRSYHFLWKNS